MHEYHFEFSLRWRWTVTGNLETFQYKSMGKTMNKRVSSENTNETTSLRTAELHTAATGGIKKPASKYNNNKNPK